MSAFERKLRAVLCCLRKKRYSSRAEAKLSARRQHVKHRAYLCSICDGFHLTSEKGPRRRNAEREELSIEEQSRIDKELRRAD